MSDVKIPEDVKQRADKAWNELATTPAGVNARDYETGIIALAILAERQRGERICVERAQQHRSSRHAYDDEASQNSCLSDAIEALSCAHAIRSSHE